jgi:hypothetical protein
VRTPEILCWLAAGARYSLPPGMSLFWRDALIATQHGDVSAMRALVTWSLRDARRLKPDDERRASRVLVARLLRLAIWELTMPEHEAAAIYGCPTWPAIADEAMRQAKARKAAA